MNAPAQIVRVRDRIVTRSFIRVEPEDSQTQSCSAVRRVQLKCGKRSLPGRLEIFVDDAGCWLYNGQLNTSGYGAVRTPFRKAHPIPRMILQLLQEVGADEFCCHHCDVRRCWNPAHLYVGNIVTNTRDAMLRGTAWTQQGRAKWKVCSNTDCAYQQIRELRANGQPYRRMMQRSLD